ncbi:hypothetical protein A946_10985 [Methylacidiphilum kamchatkense Kam1]|uniref:AsmA-like protein n=1 Tax=Methylacidiphilum kamchatkense Kam1 TaxID=1202785 RepID=A0A0C1UMP1_9BACT|nr:hypothetical protein [Methylacidiphilum kamchatkense]KIE57834.1 hypothetical protein A946_10985 [Methylacidiphilum kamchatkense Kam1]QDQ41456.1 hypothetical protein kam1_200 [Methylacidiphilum kamchatkense Kam1]
MYKNLAYLVVILSLLFVGLIVSFFSIIDGYIASQGFRTFLSQKITEAIQVEGSFEPLHLQGNLLLTDKYTGRGKPSSPIESIVGSNIECQLLLRKIFSGFWYIELLNVNNLEVVFKEQLPKELSTGSPNLSLASYNETDSPHKEAFYKNLIPTKVELKRVVINNCTLKWPKQIVGGGKLDSMSVELLKSSGTDMWTAQGKGGHLTFGSLDPLTIKELFLKIFSDGLYISKFVVVSQPHGRIEANGEWKWASKEKNMELTLDSLPLPLFLPASWKGKIDGDINGKTFLSQSPTMETSLEGTIYLKNGVIEALPLLASLALLGTTNRLPIDIGKANLFVSKSKTELSNIEMECKGKIRIEGQIEVIGDQIYGKLFTGINPEQLAFMPGAKEKVFSQEKNGYQWTTVNISGSLQNPKEDLSPRLTAAATQTIKESAGQIIQSALDFIKKIQKKSPSN